MRLPDSLLSVPLMPVPPKGGGGYEEGQLPHVFHCVVLDLFNALGSHY